MTLAANLPIKAERAPSNSWTGFYVGANAGYGWSDQSMSVTADSPALQALFLDGTGVHSIADGAKGPLVGGQAGYNWQVGHLVYGLEADFDYAHIDGNQNIAVVIASPRTFQGEQKLDWLATLRGRLGFAVTDRALVYATGGLAVGRAQSSLNFTTDSGCAVGICLMGSTSQTKAGWTIGGGLEYAISRNSSFKGEYLYYDIGHLSTIAVDPRFPPSFEIEGDVAVRGNIGRVGINYKFD
jgi:outer membrane immunogenic protein